MYVEFKEKMMLIYIVGVGALEDSLYESLVRHVDWDAELASVLFCAPWDKFGHGDRFTYTCTPDNPYSILISFAMSLDEEIGKRLQ